ncbi:hypothetical protein [Paraliomyxa miuraensis]|nr:hypothetical protein [Paraliomyxa miuraensis]MCX4240159.1 hypothetical protein [Paraliomyxa miuraensis]
MLREFEPCSRRSRWHGYSRDSPLDTMTHDTKPKDIADVVDLPVELGPIN